MWGRRVIKGQRRFSSHSHGVGVFLVLSPSPGPNPNPNPIPSPNPNLHPSPIPCSQYVNVGVLLGPSPSPPCVGVLLGPSPSPSCVCHWVLAPCPSLGVPPACRAGMLLADVVFAVLVCCWLC